MYAVKIELKMEATSDNTLAESTLAMLQKLRGDTLENLVVTVMDGRVHRSETVRDILAKARALAYEQYFSNKHGPELFAVGTLKPTAEAVVKQIKEFYDVQNTNYKDSAGVTTTTGASN